MHRFYTEQQKDDLLLLGPEDTRHALQVLRMKPGDPAEVISQGQRYSVSVADTSGTALGMKILSPLPSTEPTLRVTLFQGLPKADKMELIIQKATELGAERIVPVQMERCVVRLDSRDAEKKRERWQKIAREAGKQSCRCLQPQVDLPVTLKALTGMLSGFDAVLVPWEDARGTGPQTFARAHPDIHRVAVIIGPEGGISAGEIELLKIAGAQPLTLGPRILRTETAGLAAISALLCLYGEME